MSDNVQTVREDERATVEGVALKLATLERENAALRHQVSNREREIADLRSRLAEAERESADDHTQIMRMGELLANVAVALKGPEQDGHRHSYHDLPALALEIKATAELAKEL